MNIKETFIKLTSRTYPHGTETDIFDLVPQDLEIDEFGNLYKKIGENPTCMFTSHLDTATSAMTRVNHIFNDTIIKTDGTSILGADDKAGVTIMFYMIENKIPGLYYFFLGEEVGCVGSRKLSDVHKTEPIDGIKKVISFDRRGKTSVITFQSSSRCCSDEFANALAEQLNGSAIKLNNKFDYKPDPTGLYTDSAQFTKIYPECTNISVGYQNEHTHSEQQDIEHLENLAKACLLVDWESLPISRDPAKLDYKTSSYGWDYDYDWGYSGYDFRSYSKPISVKETSETVWFTDAKNNFFVSSVKIDNQTNRVLKAELSAERIQYELELISDLLNTLEVSYDKIKWDGFKLKVTYSVENPDHVTECDRNDLVEYILELDFWKKESGRNWSGNRVSKITQFD